MHGHSSERPGMEDNAEAEQPSTGRGEDRLCRPTAWIVAAQHVITDPHTLQGFGGSGRRGSRLGLQAWELWTAPSMRLTRASPGEVCADTHPEPTLQ